ncbi:hypothetical protein FB562_0464 [Homoserinimonas aerilata]|uniref:Uncharacterized protein n=1 Tax=Homoserinimonas aerilata TaxID=1162970 RepID=A0A542YH28_9MICO|nr:hypothetical protein [Homoserinimonas aerilata]TQL47405.1 hypothetical protein FB562_0464 [Homoserinimonas aerilata]
MATGSERYRTHSVWETLRLKQESLAAARFGDADTEEWRTDIVEWLSEALKTKLTRQPALYLGVLDSLGTALNALPVTTAEFAQYVADGYGRKQGVDILEAALRKLPLPAPKELNASYIALLDSEVEARTTRLSELQSRISETEAALASRQKELDNIAKNVESLSKRIESEREAIAEVSQSARDQIDRDWGEALAEWHSDQEAINSKNNAAALEHVATLAATARAGEALAEHAAGSLSATDWNGRAKRERRAAQWMRAGAAAAFVFAGAIGFFIVTEAVRSNFDLTVGDGILRASVALVVGAFGALLLRESGRHFREADTAEDVALSLKALAPFYAGSDDSVRIAARVQVGDAVLVKNVLSRFAHRDAAKHSAEIDTANLSVLVDDAAKALSTVQRAAKTG